MSRAFVLSAIFLGGVAVSLVAPVFETVAMAEPSGEARVTTPTPARAPTPVKGKVAPGRRAEIVGSSRCAEGMVEITGDYCPALEQTCVRWLDRKNKKRPRRCAEFAPSGVCKTKTTRKHFCIDKFEYPNAEGAQPVVMKSWYEARDACKADGKRLCGDSEWTLACEGRERLPYPYGLERDKNACNIDKPHPVVNESALANPRTRGAEAARLWQGESSGARAACVSPYGVFDMTGNVDEWVVNERGVPFKSALKGGYWGPVRDRCRPKTTAHGEDFKFYQIGFRCCGDVS